MARTQNAGESGFNDKIKQRLTKTTPKEKSRQRTVVPLTYHTNDERQRISTEIQTPGGYIGRQTSVTRET